MLRLLSLILVAALLSGCGAWRAFSPDPRPGGASSQRDPLAQWDHEVMALFLRAQLLLQGPRSTANAEQAASLLEQALERRPDEPLLWRYLGEAWAAVPDYERAAAASKRAAEMAPDDGTARFLLGQQLHRMGMPLVAEPHFRDAVALGVPGDEPHLPHYYHYTVLKELRRTEEALGALERWEQEIPGDPHPPALRARLLWDGGRADEAASAAVEALIRQPRDEDLVAMIRRYHRLDATGAAQAFEAVLVSDWSVAELHRELVDLYREIGDIDRALDHLRIVEMLERRGGIDRMIERAELLLARHDPDAVVELLLPEVTDVGVLPHQVAALFLLAQAHAERGEREQALALLGAIEGPPELVLEPVLFTAQLLRDQGDATQARAVLEDALARLGPEAVEERSRVLESLLELELERQGWGAAESTLEVLQELAPRRAVFLRADLLRAQGRRAEAVAVAVAAHESAINDLSLATLRADLLAEAGDPGAGVQILEEAEERLRQRFLPRLELAVPAQVFRLEQELEESRTFLLLRRSFVEHRAGDLAGAEATLQRVLDTQPRNADVLNGLAYLWADLGGEEQLPRAEEFVRRALEQQPYSAAYLDTLGVVLHRTGRAAAALEPLERANAYAPDEPEIQEHLADVLRDLGEMERALAVYGAALGELDSSSAGAAGMRTRIEGKVRALQATGTRGR